MIIITNSKDYGYDVSLGKYIWHEYYDMYGEYNMSHIL